MQSEGIDTTNKQSYNTNEIIFTIRIKINDLYVLINPYFVVSHPKFISRTIQEQFEFAIIIIIILDWVLNTRAYRKFKHEDYSSK